MAVLRNISNEQLEGKALIESEFRFLFEDNKVHESFHEDARRALRIQLKTKLEVNLALGAWELSHLRQTELDKAGAISRDHGESTQMGQSEYLLVLLAFQTMQPCRTPEEELPSKGELEELVTQFQNGELRADILGAYLSKEQGGGPSEGTRVGDHGADESRGTCHQEPRHHHLQPRE